MKKIVIAAALASTFALAACGGSKTPDNSTSVTNTTEVLDNGAVATTTNTSSSHK